MARYTAWVAAVKEAVRSEMPQRRPSADLARRGGGGDARSCGTLLEAERRVSECLKKKAAPTRDRTGPPQKQKNPQLERLTITGRLAVFAGAARPSGR